MSIQLDIDWEDGRTFNMPLAGQSTAVGRWAQIVKERGLKHYTGIFPLFLDPEILDEMIAEFTAIREGDALLYGHPSDRLDKLLNKLKSLHTETNWSGMIG